MLTASQGPVTCHQTHHHTMGNSTRVWGPQKSFYLFTIFSFSENSMNFHSIMKTVFCLLLSLHLELDCVENKGAHNE